MVEIKKSGINVLTDGVTNCQDDLILPRAGETVIEIFPSNTSSSMDERFLIRAKQIVDLNIGRKSFGVQQLAEQVNLSRAQLFRKLKAIVGISPNAFINEIRLQRAALLILSKADTIGQICYTVGFTEQSYFAKSFRKKFGMSPTEYAKKKLAPRVKVVGQNWLFGKMQDHFM